VFADLDGRLLTINPDGSELSTVFEQEGSWVRTPAWSPDGSQVMFVLDPSPSHTLAPNGIYVINADGAGLTPVIESPDHKGLVLSARVPDIRDRG
jgi:Tol biopolymer transport system component